MIHVKPKLDEPTYEELQQECIWLKGSLREARRICRENAGWKMGLLFTSTVSTLILILTWAGCISI